MQPRVTVLIAHHNYERYLKKCLESCLSQTYPCNVCLVDDGSQDIDAVDSIVKEMGMTNLTFLSLDKATGPSNARNVGITETILKTDAYVILDADDYMYDNKVERLVKTWSIAPEMIGVVYADYHTENELTGNVSYEYKEPYSLNRLRQECIVHSGALISAKALSATRDEFGYYDKHMRTCEDFDLWIRIGEQFMIMHVPEPLTYVRIQPNNSTETVDKSIWEANWTRISQKLQQRNNHANK